MLHEKCFTLCVPDRGLHFLTVDCYLRASLFASPVRPVPPLATLQVNLGGQIINYTGNERGKSDRVTIVELELEREDTFTT